MPVEPAAWGGAISDELLQAKVHGCNGLVGYVILVEHFQDEAIRGERPLDRQPELLLNRRNLTPGLDCSRANLLSSEFTFDERVNRAKCVQMRQLHRLDESDLQLLELFLDLGGHQDDGIGSVGSRLVIQLDLLVAGALDRDTDLQVAGDLAEILALGVHQGEPLVLEGMLFLEVDRGHVELVGANQFVTEDAFVHDLNSDCLHLYLACVDVARLEKHVLLPLGHSCAAARHIILRSGVLLFTTCLHGNQRIDSVTIGSKVRSEN